MSKKGPKMTQIGSQTEKILGPSLESCKSVNDKNTDKSIDIRMLYRSDTMARWRARRCAPLDIVPTGAEKNDMLTSDKWTVMRP